MLWDDCWKTQNWVHALEVRKSVLVRTRDEGNSRAEVLAENTFNHLELQSWCLQHYIPPCIKEWIVFRRKKRERERSTIISPQSREASELASEIVPRKKQEAWDTALRLWLFAPGSLSLRPRTLWEGLPIQNHQTKSKKPEWSSSFKGSFILPGKCIKWEGTLACIGSSTEIIKSLRGPKLSNIISALSWCTLVWHLAKGLVCHWHERVLIHIF